MAKIKFELSSKPETFDNKICRACGLPATCGEIDYEELKQEAINWINKLIGLKKITYKMSDVAKETKNNKSEGEIDGVIIYRKAISFIEHFFNITEDDLK